jgi:hypothetical protein
MRLFHMRGTQWRGLLRAEEVKDESGEITQRARVHHIRFWSSHVHLAEVIYILSYIYGISILGPLSAQNSLERGIHLQESEALLNGSDIHRFLHKRIERAGDVFQVPARTEAIPEEHGRVELGRGPQEHAPVFRPNSLVIS